MEKRKRILVFASGDAIAGGSGAQWLIEATKTGRLKGQVVAVVSSHEYGGVRKICDAMAIPFVFMPKPYNAEAYLVIVDQYNPDLICLSGWLWPTKGLNPRIVINIHPGSTKDFGGKGMWGHHVHEAVVAAFEEGRIDRTMVSMHFVTDEIDGGPVFFQYELMLRKGDTAEDVAKRVNEVEHAFQAYITNLVLRGDISWDGEDPESLVVPDWYEFCPDQDKLVA